METLTADEFNKKYGVIAASQFSQPGQQEGLFQSIKNDIAQRGASNVDILNQPSSGGIGDVAKGFDLAANTAGAIPDVAGEILKRTPVGGILGTVGDAAKKGFKAVTDKLAGTDLFKGAAGHTIVNAGGGTDYVPNKVGAEEGLRISSAGGQIAGDILATDVGAGALKRGANIVKSVPGAVRQTGAALPDLGKASSYIDNAIKDVVPSRQGLIDHNIAKALDLTPGDLSNISKSTGNDVGRWLSDNNLIGTNKATTLSLIKTFFSDQYKAVRAQIDAVKTTYDPSEVPYFQDTLKSLKAEVDGKVGLEDINKQIDTLLKKEQVTLSDVQQTKEMLDNYYTLYKVTGDVQAGVTKQGLANVRTQLKSFIESEVKKNGGADIRQMNNNVATARSLEDAIATRSPRGLTRANVTWRDFAVGAGLTYFSTPVIGLAVVLIKKVVTSPTFRLRFARYLDQLDDAQKAKLSGSLKNGTVPSEVIKAVGPLEEPTPTPLPKAPGAAPKTDMISPDLSPLAKEAQKYSSAEEFVKAQGKPIYHSTDSTQFSTFDSSKAAKGETFFNPLGDGMFLSSNKDFTTRFGKNTFDYVLPKDANTKIITDTKFAQSEYPAAIKGTLKQLGIDYNKLDLGDKVQLNRLQENNPPIQALNEAEFVIREDIAPKFGVKLKPNQVKDIMQGIMTARNAPYDAVIYRSTDYALDKADEIIIPKDKISNLKTPSQLTDFYNKVKGGTGATNPNPI